MLGVQHYSTGTVLIVLYWLCALGSFTEESAPHMQRLRSVKQTRVGRSGGSVAQGLSLVTGEAGQGVTELPVNLE